MILKFIVFLILSASTFVHAEDCMESLLNISDLTNATTIRNCNKPSLLRVDFNTSSRGRSRASQTQQVTVCNECRSDFSRNVGSNPITDRELRNLKQNAYIDILHNEMEKILSSTMVDIVALRENYETGSKFNSAKSKCSYEAFETKVNQNCGSKKTNILNRDLKGKLTSELVALLSPVPHRVKGILNRGNQNQCNISDQEILSLKPRVLEASISPELALKISSYNFSNTNDLLRQLEEDSGASSLLFKSHPLFGALIKEPRKFIDFFKTLSSSANSSNFTTKLQEQLYKPEYGNLLDNDIARRCSAAYDTFVSKVCSPAPNDLESKSIGLGPIQNYEKFLNGSNGDENTELSHSPAIIKNNLLLFQFCPTPNDNEIKVSDAINEMYGSVSNDEKEPSLSEYAFNKYSQDLGGVADSVCEKLRSQDSCPSTDVTKACNFFRAYKTHKDLNSTENRLASSLNESINELLRSFIGNGGANLPPESKRVLIAEGILPQADGTFVRSAPIPEREPNFLSNLANNVAPSSQSAPAQAATARGQSARAANAPQASALDPSTFSNFSTPTEQSTSALTDSDEARLSAIQDQIMRRISHAGATPPTREQVAREVRQVYRNNNRPLSPTQEAQVVEQVMASAASAPGADPAWGSTGTFANGRASLGPDGRPSRAAQQRNAALADMQGARNNPFANVDGGNANRAPANAEENNATQLSTVAVVIAGDVRSNTSVLSTKLQAMLQNENDFILKLNDIPFTIDFVERGRWEVKTQDRGPAASALKNELQEYFNSVSRTPASLSNLRSNLNQ